MKYLLYTILLISLFTSCKEKKDNYIIEGKIKNLNNSELYIVTSKEAGVLQIDTIQCTTEGKFSFKGLADSLSSVVIYMEKGTVWATIWTKNKDKISMSGDARYPELILAKGNEINDLLYEFKVQNKDLLKEVRDLSDRQSNIHMLDTLSSEISETQIKAKLSNVHHQLKEKAEEFIQSHPASIASLILMQDYLVDPDNPDNLREYLSLITGEPTQSQLYKDLSALSKTLQQTAVGSVAPDFTVIDTNNDTIHSTSFKGEYFLLSFAASWCEVCKNENKEYANIRKKYGNNKLKMLTVSLDENKDDWMTVAKKEQFSWPQVVDTRGWGSEIVSLYNITNLPSNLLMDENNIIIARNVSPESLADLLKEKLKQ